MKIYGQVMPFTEELSLIKTKEGYFKLKVHNDNKGGFIYLNKDEALRLSIELKKLIEQ